MAPQPYRGLWQEIHGLRDENSSLRLEQIGAQWRLDQQASSYQQLQARLEEVNKQLREELESHKATKEQLRDSLDINTKLREQLEEQKLIQAQLEEAANRNKQLREEIMGLLAQLNAKENAKQELRLDLGNQEALNNELQICIENMRDQIDKLDNGIAEETKEAYRMMFMASDRADKENKRANEEHSRAEEQKARAEAEKAHADEVREEANNYMHRVNCMFRIEREARGHWQACAKDLSQEVASLRADNMDMRQSMSDFVTLLKDNED